MRTIILTLLILLAVSQSLTCDFQDYIRTYRRTYASQEEHAIRKNIFMTNCLRAQNVNAQNLGYTLGINNFTDRSQDEISAFLQVSYSPSQNAVPSDQVPKVKDIKGTDWRKSGIITPVKTQGGCGSCWAFSAVAVFEAMYSMKTGSQIDASEQAILQCSGNYSSCKGGFVHDATTRLCTLGVPSETSFPYTAPLPTGGTPSTSGICESPINYKLPGTNTAAFYRNLTDQQVYALIDIAPIVALVMADTGFLQYSSGTYACSTNNPSQIKINHAITLVGYDTDGNYIIKNSWGSNWGVRGFMKLNKTYDCGIKMFTYGINSTASNRQFIQTSTFDFTEQSKTNNTTPTPNPTPTPPTPTPTPSPTPATKWVVRLLMSVLLMALTTLLL